MRRKRVSGERPGQENRGLPSVSELADLDAGAAIMVCGDHVQSCVMGQINVMHQSEAWPQQEEKSLLFFRKEGFLLLQRFSRELPVYRSRAARRRHLFRCG